MAMKNFTHRLGQIKRKKKKLPCSASREYHGRDHESSREKRDICRETCVATGEVVIKVISF